MQQWPRYPNRSRMVVIVSGFQESRPEVAIALQDFLVFPSRDSPPASHVARLHPSACPLRLAHEKPLQSLSNLPREAVPQSPSVYPAPKVSTPIAHPRLVPDASVRFVALHPIAARRPTGVTVGCSGATDAIALKGRGSISRSSIAEEKGKY